MISPWPMVVALVVSLLLSRLPLRGHRGVGLSLAVGAGLWWAGASPGLSLWLAAGGGAVALLPRGRAVGAGLWLVGALVWTAGPLLQRQGLVWSGGAILALLASGGLGGVALVRAQAPGRGLVLALAAVGVALAMLLPGSSVRLGMQGMVVAAALLPLVWGTDADADAGLAWVGAGLLALGAWTSVLLGALDWTGLWLLPLLGVPWLGAALRGRSPRLAVAAQVAAVVGVTAAVLAEEVWTLWTGGMPL